MSGSPSEALLGPASLRRQRRPPQTAAAASSVQPPENTDRRRSRRRSSSGSRSQLQSMSAWSVCWRGTAVRRPPVSSRNRSPRRWRISPTDRTGTRAAASSMANGMPSRRWQISATIGALAGVSSKAGATAIARSVKRRTESEAASASNDQAAPASRDGQAALRGACSCPGRHVRWHGQRRDLDDRLARDAERFATGGHDRQRRAGLQQRLGQRGGGADDVLAVVEEQEHRLEAQVVGQADIDGRVRLVLDAERSGHLRGHRRWVGDRRQLDQPDAVRVGIDEAAGDLEHEPRLARAAGADERHQPVRRPTAGGPRPARAPGPTNDVSWMGRFERPEPTDRSGAKSRARPGPASS